MFKRQPKARAGLNSTIYSHTRPLLQDWKSRLFKALKSIQRVKQNEETKEYVSNERTR